jgi:hypothetical protein
MGGARKSRPDSEPITIRGHASVADKARSDYSYLSFEVPSGTRRIHVHYDYTRTSMAESRRGQENILDIGVFAPDPATGRPEAFRGWSGGARTEFFIEPASATPGYLPGPLPEGIWQIILGLYRIAEAGCDYTVTVTLDAGASTGGDNESSGMPESDPSRAPRSGDTPDTRGTWYVGDLQSHTYHSDAKASPAHLARVAQHRGLEFLAVTDHNTISHHAELPGLSDEGFLLMPAMEITTYYGHANAWGLSKWVDFRCKSVGDVTRSVAAACGQGAIVSINHPYSDCPWTYGMIPGVEAIEVWQGLWNRGNQQAVAWWDELLSAGRRVTGVGGSDRHEPAHYDPLFPHQVGTPATRIRAGELSTRALLAAIRRGEVTIAETPGGPWLEIRVLRDDGSVARVGDSVARVPDEEVAVECLVTGAGEDTLELVANGQIVARHMLSPGEENVVLRIPPAGALYVRGQIVAGHDEAPPAEESYPRFRALCNPIYLTDQADNPGGRAHGRE